MDKQSDLVNRLSQEYISKVKCCDECFCECFCTTNGVRKSRVPYEGCHQNLKTYLFTIFNIDG